jgi:hypothetical protein
VADHLQQLGQDGFAWIRHGIADAEEAFEVARGLVNGRCAADGEAALRLVGAFILPPSDGQDSRDFQTLHFDFGVSLDPKVKQDFARYTALHIPAGFGQVSAVTRLVPLASLLAQRAWPSEAELLGRFVAYGRTHGAWNDDQGYVEGSLARIVEAAAGAPALPSVKADGGFLCGMEFDSIGAELRFFARHSLRVDEVQIDVALLPGELLIFDNLAVAHGRRGLRRPGELRQWVFGETLSVAGQLDVRSQVLAAFGAPRSIDHTTAVSASIP